VRDGLANHREKDYPFARILGCCWQARQWSMLQLAQKTFSKDSSPTLCGRSRTVT
jgi:hypothetical protein